MYNWNEIKDGFDKMPIGLQEVKLYRAYVTTNANGKPYMAIKGSLPDLVDNCQELDELGRKIVTPHASINIYFETDYGQRVLKNLLKAAFGEDNLKYMVDNDAIILYIERKQPKVMGLIEQKGNYSNFVNFEFKPAPVAGEFPEESKQPKQPKKETGFKTGSSVPANNVPDLPPGQVEDDDLPF